jgi:hypothetical protein
MVLYDDESDESLWQTTEFNKQTLMTKHEFSEFLSQAYQSLEPPTSALKYNTDTHPFLKRFYAKEMRDVSGNTVKYKSIYAEHSSRHETHIGQINLCSDLASDSFIMGDNGVLRNTDVLEYC